MSQYNSGRRDGSQERKAHDHSDDKIQYLWQAEERLLQLISNRTPLPKVLNEICSALDCQIGSVVSLISLPGDDAGELAAIAMNATLFGLHTFCSEKIVAENEELLGFLEMYSGMPRCPSSDEAQFIERAKCLTAIAIQLHHEAGRQGSRGARGNRPVRGNALEWPASLN
jgi:hypothetical protein